MASSSFSGLKELLLPTSENTSITKRLEALVLSASPSPSDFDLAKEFDEKLLVESNVKVSPQGSFSSPSLLSDYVITEISGNLGKKKLKCEDSDGNGGRPEKRNGESIEKKQLNGGKCFPPPISCFRKVKVGKPFKYLAYDKESESYVAEEITIPNGSLFCASREGARLKLYKKFSDEET